MAEQHFPGGLGALYNATDFNAVGSNAVDLSEVSPNIVEPRTANPLIKGMGFTVTEEEQAEPVYPFEAAQEEENTVQEAGTKKNTVKEKPVKEKTTPPISDTAMDIPAYQVCEVPALEVLSVNPQNNFLLVEYRSIFDSIAVLQTPALFRIHSVQDYVTSSPVIPVNLAQFVRGLCCPFPPGHKMTEENWLHYISNKLIPELNRFIESWVGESTAPASNPFRAVFFGKNGILTGMSGMSYSSIQIQVQTLLPMLKDSVHLIQMRYKGRALLLECVSPQDVTKEYYVTGSTNNTGTADSSR
jgi:hypothetical protein